MCVSIQQDVIVHDMMLWSVVNTPTARVYRSEANDLALQIAKAVSGNEHVISFSG